MTIGVDARFLQSDEHPELRDFTFEVFTRLAILQASIQFVFFTNKMTGASQQLPENINVVTLTPKPTNFFLYKWYYDVKLAKALKKYKVNAFIATYGLACLNTSIPQLLILRNLSFLDLKTGLPNKSYLFYKRYTPDFIKKAKKIVTLSEFIKKEVIDSFNIKGDHIVNIGSGVSDSFKPVEYIERERIKEKYASGCEYFVLLPDLPGTFYFLNVLKAFSIFKKRQKTNMKLLIVLHNSKLSEKDLEKLSSYKYREEVIVKKALSEIEVAEIIAAAYALIFLSDYNGFALNVLNAIHCNVPVITTKNSSMSEFAQDAALYADPAGPEELAEQMKMIFKDEQVRNRLVATTKLRAELFKWDKTVSHLSAAIEDIVLE